MVKNFPEWIIAVPRSMITIAMIPLILKYVFGYEKKPGVPKPAETKPAVATVPTLATPEKPVFKAFKGGAA